MTKLTLAFALLLTASAAARAQLPGGSPGSDPLREAMRQGDAAKVEEAHIRASRISGARSEREAAAARRDRPQTFKAEIRVMNSAAKAIKSVVWTATLTDPLTGAVLRTYEVESETSIAPGKTKKLSKRLRKPGPIVVNASTGSTSRIPVADLKVAVTGVTYVDGSTSTTP